MAKYSIALLKGFNTVRVYPLSDTSTLIGRGLSQEEIESFIDLEEYDQDIKVSKEHLLISCDDFGVSVEDLASTNGSILNCTEELAANEPRYLKHGDQILIGKLLLEFRVEE